MITVQQVNDVITLLAIIIVLPLLQLIILTILNGLDPNALFIAITYYTTISYGLIRHEPKLVHHILLTSMMTIIIKTVLL